MNTAIIVGAGKGARMKANINKQFLLLKEKPILSHTVQVFNDSTFIDEILLVINPMEEDFIVKKVLDPYKYKKPIRIVGGGKERQDSVHNGLSQVGSDTSIVLIHDGARPLVTDRVIERCILGAKEDGAVVSGVPAKETIKIVSKNGYVDHTPKREELWVTQTPQAFSVDIIRKAHEFAKENKILGTDDAMLVEEMGHKVKMVMGDYENIKITTPEDLVIAEGILGIR